MRTGELARRRARKAPVDGERRPPLSAARVEVGRLLAQERQRLGGQGEGRVRYGPHTEVAPRHS